MNKRLYLLSSILWFVSAACWLTALIVDAVYGVTPALLTVLHALALLTSLAAAVLNLLRHRRKGDSQRP